MADDEITETPSEAYARGVSETLTRFDEVLGLDEAKGREAQALALFKAGVTAEQARSILAAAPVSGGSSLERRIASEHGTVGAPALADQHSHSSTRSGWSKAVAAVNEAADPTKNHNI